MARKPKPPTTTIDADEYIKPLDKQVRTYSAEFTERIGSGRVPGVPNRLPFEYRKTMREFSPQANDVLKKIILDDSVHPMVRVMAIKEVNDRAWGRVASAKDDDGDIIRSKRISVTFAGDQPVAQTIEYRDSSDSSDSGDV